MTNLHTIFVRTQSCCLHFQYKVSPHVTSTSPQTSPPASPPVEDEKELLAPAQLVLPWGPNDFVCPCVEDMGVSKNCGTPKSYQIIHFNRLFHYKPSIWGGFPLFLETPICLSQHLFLKQIAAVFWHKIGEKLSLRMAKRRCKTSPRIT